MIKPEQLNLKKFLKENSVPYSQEVSVKEMALPDNLPDMNYTLSKYEDGNLRILHKFGGRITFVIRQFLEENVDKGGSVMHVGHALRTDNPNFFYMTSVLSEVVDKNDHLLFKTMNGSTYRIDPMSLATKKDFLGARGV